MRKFTFIVLFLISHFISKGQVLCGTLEPTQFKSKNSSAYSPNILDTTNTTSYLPIEIHIIRKSDGSGSTSLADINAGLANLNAYYLQSGIQFYIAHDTPLYINSDTFYNFDSSEESQLCTEYDVNNAINLYILGTITTNGSPVNGYAYYPAPLSSSNRVFIKGSSFTDQRTVIHEFGHYFNLYHTFQSNNSTDPTKKELVTRGLGANCSTAGDYVCDTPADPYGLTGASYSGCNYTGTIRDSNNDLYLPNLANVMSYYSNCGNSFSIGQYQRMANGLLLRKDSGNRYNYSAQNTGGSAPTNLVATKTSSGVNVSFQDNSNSEFGYIIERHDEKSSLFVAIKGVSANTTSIIDTNIVSNKIYSYRVRASNSTIYSNTDTANVKISYCLPTYTNNCSPTIIAEFTLNGTGISKLNSGCGTNSYSDFSSIVGNVTTGNTYTFTAKALNNIFETYNPQHVTIWIDFNQDGIFDNDTEKAYHTTNSVYMNPILSNNFTIPQSAWAGKTRMRVRSNYVIYGIPTDACSKLTFGETEDYTLNITNNNSIVTTNVSSTSLCPNSTFTVEFTKSNFNPSDYVVQIAEVGSTNFINLTTTGTASPLTALIPANIIGNKNYQVRVVSLNPQIIGSVSSSTLYVKTTPTNPIFNMSDATICIGQNVVASVINCSDGLISWSTGSNETSLNLAPITTSSYSATCTINGCISGSSSLNIGVTPIPEKPSITPSESSICYGESVTLIASNCDGIIDWSTGYKENILKTYPLVTSTYSAICKIGECASSSTSTTVTVKTSPIASISGPNRASKGQNIVLNITLNSGALPWDYSLSNGKTKTNISTSADTIQIIIDSSSVFYISQISNICGNGIGRDSVSVLVDNPATRTFLDIKAFLEGALLQNTQNMKTILNQRGLLPGQTPIGTSAKATPAGQPYNKSPWNYGGTENISSYPSEAVDWVLVSIRKSIAVQDSIWRGAGILKSNGQIDFPNSELLPFLKNDSSYYVSLEHRNHLGVLSHHEIQVKNDTLSYDFSLQNSYTQTPITSSGQKLIGTIFALFSSDGVKNPSNQNFDINISELLLWKTENGLFDSYLDSDFNLDAEINFMDRAIFKQNNGIFSMISQ